MPRKYKRVPNYFIVIVVVILGLVIWNYRTSWAASNLSAETAQIGWLKHEKLVKVVFANTETLLTSPAEGKVILPEDEGTRFRKDETIARIVPTGVDRGGSKDELSITSPTSGLFYSYRDSLEQIITPENLMNMELNSLLAQTPQPQLTSSSTEVDRTVSKYAPIGKIVNNLYPTWMFVYLNSEDTMAKGDFVRFYVGQDEYTGSVMRVSAEPRGAVIRFSQYIKGSTENRTQEISWSYQSSTKGVLIPLSAVCTFGEEKGVYIGQDGIIRFKVVKVLDTNENLACVEGLPEGTVVITNPKKGIEGWTMKTNI